MASVVRKGAIRLTNLPRRGMAWDDPELLSGYREVRRGRLAEGRQLLAATRADPDRRALRLSVLSRAAIKHLDQLTRLSDAEPQDPDLALWLGSTRIDHAWELRSARRASQVSREAFERFWLALGSVAEPLQRAIELLPDDPTPWDRLQWRGLGLQVDRAEIDEVWTELSRRSPFSFAGCYSRVQVLCEKWQGSNEELFEFAENTALAAPANHPVRSLPVAAQLELAAEKRVPLRKHFTSIHDRIAWYADGWVTDPMPHPYTIEAHHMFGAAFYFGGDRDRAARHLGQVSRKSMPWYLPWTMLGANPGLRYRELRFTLGLD